MTNESSEYTKWLHDVENMVSFAISKDRCYGIQVCMSPGFDRVLINKTTYDKLSVFSEEVEKVFKRIGLGVSKNGFIHTERYDFETINHYLMSDHITIKSDRTVSVRVRAALTLLIHCILIRFYTIVDKFLCVRYFKFSDTLLLYNNTSIVFNNEIPYIDKIEGPLEAIACSSQIGSFNKMYEFEVKFGLRSDEMLIPVCLVLSKKDIHRLIHSDTDTDIINLASNLSLSKSLYIKKICIDIDKNCIANLKNIFNAINHLFPSKPLIIINPQWFTWQTDIREDISVLLNSTWTNIYAFTKCNGSITIKEWLECQLNACMGPRMKIMINFVDETKSYLYKSASDEFKKLYEDIPKRNMRWNLRSQILLKRSMRRDTYMFRVPSNKAGIFDILYNKIYELHIMWNNCELWTSKRNTKNVY